MSAESIYSKLRIAGMSHEGACGMLGNLQAESNLISNIAQRGMTSLSDDAYTTKFDTNPMSCIRDGVGYGLAQWTFWSRKQGLADFARARGVSVGDEDMQVDYIIHELKAEYAELFTYLCSTDELYVAADRVCREYERPAVNNVNVRYQYAKVFAGSLQPEQEKFIPPDVSILVLQAVLVGNGYNTEITGHKNADFLAKLRQFTTDIGG